ncbi:MAG TPA: ion channel [Salegentibacter sp.]|uniref:ion channel n=1 Tax=Salegentibacter sp. TaxID=1903072 RepID=UPI002F91E1F8
MSGIYLLIGILLLLIAIHDFFFTTLSGSGTGFLSRKISVIADKLIQICVKICGRKVYNYNGLFVNLMILFSWLLLIWIGLFLIYTSNPEAITNSSGRMANHWERLYFTSYTLSTLGMGNFKPNTPIFELLTGSFSFFGFIFFTSAMTYFLSVSSALINKRSLSKSVYNMGESPQAIAKSILSFDSSFRNQQILELQKMIDRHSVNHHAYPVVHFYRKEKKKDSFGINIARLDETVSILLNSQESKKFREELLLLRNSLSGLFEDIEENFSSNHSTAKDMKDSFNFTQLDLEKASKDLKNNRRITGDLLKSENFTWKDVYSKN